MRAHPIVPPALNAGIGNKDPAVRMPEPHEVCAPAGVIETLKLKTMIARRQQSLISCVGYPFREQVPV